MSVSPLLTRLYHLPAPPQLGESRSTFTPARAESFGRSQSVVCGQNCTFVIQSNGTVMACGEGSYGRLGQGNSDDLHALTVISGLQGQTGGPSRV